MGNPNLRSIGRKLDDVPPFVAHVLSLRWARYVNRQRALVGAWLLLCTLLLLRDRWINTQAQTQPGRDDDEVVRVKSNLVNLDLTVKDKKGRYITDLKA